MRAVLMLVITTFAPSRTAPEGSVTVPAILPVEIVACEKLNVLCSSIKANNALLISRIPLRQFCLEYISASFTSAIRVAQRVRAAPILWECLEFATACHQPRTDPDPPSAGVANGAP